MFKTTETIICKYKSLKLLIKSTKLVLLVAPFQSGCLIIAVSLQGIMPAVSIAISGTIINSMSSSRVSTPHHLMYICSLWAGSLLVYNLIGPVILFLQGRIAQKAIYKVNSDILYKSSLIHGLEAFENKVFHDDIQIIQSQASHKPLNLLVTLIGVFKDSLLTVSCLGLLYRQMPWISLFIGLSAYLNFRVFSQIQKINWQETLGRSPKSRLMNYIASISANPVYAKELRFFPIGSYLLEKYKILFNEITKSMSQIQLKQIYLPIIPLCFSVLGMFTSLWIILSRVQAQVIPIGSIAIVLQGLTQLHLSICSLGEQLGWIPGHVLFFNKFFNFLTLKETVFNKIPDIDFESHKNLDQINILFDTVSFTYPGKETAQALTNISFSIGKRQKVAIVGANGAGKSTLIKLVCGLYAPDTGTISINGISIDNLDLKDFRSHIAPVFQDFCPYALSVEKNITMGAPITDTLQAVVQKSGVQSILDQLPNGLDTELGKTFGGTELSLGQWQKIALARALYKDASLYIFDEPTAALDPLSEAELFENFAQVTEGKTVIFITHRLQSVVHADHILLLDAGELKAQGTHSELMQVSPLYMSMFQAQAKYYQD